MQEYFFDYSPAIFGLGVFGVLYLAQLLVADFVAISRRHTPGTSVAQDHDDFLFRVTRAHANTSESVGAFILIVGFASMAGGSPNWVNALVWAFVACRTVHTAAYYLDQRFWRSGAFGAGMLCLFLLFTVGARAL